MGVRNGDLGSRIGSNGMVSGMAGALIGAAGLAWWLLAEAEKRRLDGRQQRVLRLSRHAEADEFDPSPGARPLSRIQGQKDLHNKVHELNQAIEDVRRQLEGMATSR
jgi:hypothetical protein